MFTPFPFLFSCNNMHITSSPFAFCLIHFGKNPKYLEYELYFLLNLRQHTSYDILYLYSIADTPPSYPQAVKNLNIPNPMPDR